MADYSLSGWKAGTRAPEPVEAPPSAADAELTDADVEGMVELLRGAATLSTVTTPAELIEVWLNGVTIYDEHGYHGQWTDVSARSKERLELESLFRSLIEFHSNHDHDMKQVAKSLAAIYLEDDDLVALAGGDPLPNKMKKARRLRHG